MKATESKGEELHRCEWNGILVTREVWSLARDSNLEFIGRQGWSGVFRLTTVHEGNNLHGGILGFRLGWKEFASECIYVHNNGIVVIS